MKYLVRSFLLMIAIALVLMSCNLQSNNRPTSQKPSSAKYDGAIKNFKSYCTGCHGKSAEEFVSKKWLYGKDRQSIEYSIKTGYPDDGMPAFDVTFGEKDMKELIDYIEHCIQKDKLERKTNRKGPGIIVSDELDFRLDTITTDLSIPWGIAFLPNGDCLITERDGFLYRLDGDRTLNKIGGLPPVLARGQGGLLDVCIDPDFKTNQRVFISYSAIHPEKRNLSTTAILSATLKENQLLNSKVIFTAMPYSTTRHHYGSKMVFDKAGYLYFSVGDRGNRDENPQSLDNHCGKIHRINPDGSIPEDNPFVDKAGAMGSIYSYGHRNPQGVTLHPVTGKVWTHEHGPKGGDEVNIITKALNYGWPVISYGINYNGTKFTKLKAKEGMEQPLVYWVPSIAPCGMSFVSGDRFSDWEGSLLVGSLRFDYLKRCKVVDDKIVAQEELLKGIGRVRAIEMGLDGYLYVAVEAPGALYRIVPLD